MTRTIWADRLVATAIALSRCSRLPKGLPVDVVHCVLATGRSFVQRSHTEFVCVAEWDQVQPQPSTPIVSKQRERSESENNLPEKIQQVGRIWDFIEARCFVRV